MFLLSVLSDLRPIFQIVTQVGLKVKNCTIYVTQEFEQMFETTIVLEIFFF